MFACNCRASTTGETKVVAKATASDTVESNADGTLPAGAHGSGRDRWRGGGVYLDGQPIAMLRHAELPAALKPVWDTQRTRLPFKAGEEIRYSETKVPRYRMTDYLSALGISIKDITEVHILGTKDTAIVVTKAQLLSQPDDIRFKFTGETSGKPVPLVRNIDAATSFDDIRGLTIYMKRTPPTLNAQGNLELDGREVHGIAYYGEPMREGVRVYVDDRLATTLKRNQLYTNEKWQLADVLAKQGVATHDIKTAALIYEEERTSEIAFANLAFSFNAGHSGEILVGAASTPANAIALYTKPPQNPAN